MRNQISLGFEQNGFKICQGCTQCLNQSKYSVPLNCLLLPRCTHSSLPLPSSSPQSCRCRIKVLRVESDTMKNISVNHRQSALLLSLVSSSHLSFSCIFQTNLERTWVNKTQQSSRQMSIIL